MNYFWTLDETVFWRIWTAKININHVQKNELQGPTKLFLAMECNSNDNQDCS